MTPRRGQSALEYGALVVVVAAALAGMAVYMKRAVSGKLRSSSDSVGEQYHPRATTSNLTMSTRGTTKTTSTMLIDQIVAGTKVNVLESTTVSDQTTNRTGTEDVGAMGASIWN